MIVMIGMIVTRANSDLKQILVVRGNLKGRFHTPKDNMMSTRIDLKQILVV